MANIIYAIIFNGEVNLTTQSREEALARYHVLRAIFGENNIEMKEFDCSPRKAKNNV